MEIGPLSTVENAHQFLLALLRSVKFPIRNSKLEHPSSRCNCICVIVDTQNATFTVPQVKFQEVMDKYKDTLGKVNLRKQQLQSIIGSLLFVPKCVSTTGYFVNMLLHALREAKGKTIPLNEAVERPL